MPTQPLELRGEPRSTFGKHVRRLRRQGIVPANLFGHGASRAFQTPMRSLEHVLARGGRTGLVTIALDDSSQTALLKEVQRDPRSGQIVHVAFQAVSLEETVTSVVPLRFVGESPAVSRFNGILMHPTTELRVEARAADLPDVIEVDVSGLVELHAAIHVGDLPPTGSCRVLDPPDEVIAVVLPPKVELEEVVAAAEAEAEAAAVKPAAETQTAAEG